MCVCLYSVRTGGLPSWPAGEGFIAATGKGVWIEDDQAGSPEERLSPVQAGSSRLVSSRLVLSSLAAVSYSAIAVKLAGHDGSASKATSSRKTCEMKWWMCLAWTWPRPTETEAAKRAVLYYAAYGVRSTRRTALLLGTQDCGTHGGVLVELAGTALLSADGFNATSQSAQSQPPLNLPFAPPNPVPLGGRTPINNACEPLVAGPA